ncbi:outer membrane beta-barrel protein [Massilia sp. BSC265]|uniref:outer membrane beta-barrel protein n=1 Tax=Massilia sp. BSC265 TaxID=1549812 RepID=UPI0004E97B88|nr:outer membrane beta-barrel protein [Massilia sp. BSC265]KFI07558.1 hypothetical protein JN27_08170 [Massilia sp. BSC265]
MFKKFATVTALIIASSAAFAAQPDTFYAGADVGRTKINDMSGRDTSYGAFVGYNFHQNFAVEAGYRRLADYDFLVAGAGSSIIGGSESVNQAHLSVIGSLPVGEGFSVYSRLGVNHLRVKAKAGNYKYSGSENKALYGVGVSYAFSPAVSARLEVQKPASDATNLSAGVAFQF